MQLICTNCKKGFYGRSDKKFCSLKCKNTMSNSKRKLPVKIIKEVHSRIKENYRILRKYYKGKSIKVLQSQLISEGFNFQYFTQGYTNPKGEHYRYCYDLGFLILDDDQVLIVRNNYFTSSLTYTDVK